jgi:hypothetical protein
MLEIDIKTLERLSNKIKEDMMSDRTHGLNKSAALSIADIIDRAIGAPLAWPSRRDGAKAADDLFPGSPAARHQFNWGVKWAVENYCPTYGNENT